MELQNIICKVNGDLIEKQVQHDGYDRFDETQQFSPSFLKHIQSSDYQNTPLFFLAIQLSLRQTQIAVWVQQRERVSHFVCVSFSQDFAVAL